MSLGRKRDRGREIAEIILRLGNYKRKIEQDFLIAARRIDRRNPDGKDGEKLSNREDVVKLFLSHDRDFWATESILVAALDRLPSRGNETLQLYFNEIVVQVSRKLWSSRLKIRKS